MWCSRRALLPRPCPVSLRGRLATHLATNGIMASRSDMVKFRSRQDCGYPVVFAALRRYIRHAPEVIGLKWRKERRPLAQESRREVQAQHQNCAVAAEITQSSITTDPEDINEIYAVLRSSSNYFTGRKLYAEDMKEAFNAPRGQSMSHRQKVFVIYGLGVSGKTQFCLKYIEDNKSRFDAPTLPQVMTSVNCSYQLLRGILD